MQLKPPFKKLLIVSLYTSPVIGALLITPTFILTRYVHGLYAHIVLSMTALIFLLWLCNIAIAALTNKWQVKRAYALLFSYALSIIFIPLFQHAFLPLVNEVGPQQTFHFHLIVFSAINTVILVIKDLVLTREKNAAIALENTQLKMKNLEAANERLKQQVHPHFLFNSLSTLKTLITSSPEHAEEYLIKLSGFLRYSLSSNTLNAVKVSEELNSCIDYLEMQKIRFGDALLFNVDIPEQVKASCWIPIFSLQVLAENAIKHNALTVAEPLRITITFVEGHIVVSNNIQPKLVAEASAGIGLANLRERYKILSGEGILVEQTDHTFLVRLKVFDNENCNNRG